MARRVGALLAALAVGLVLFLGLMTVAVTLIVKLHDRSGDAVQRQRDALVGRYQQEYDACVRGGSAANPCSETVFEHCAADPFWLKEYEDAVALSEISGNCNFGGD